MTSQVYTSALTTFRMFGDLFGTQTSKNDHNASNQRQTSESAGDTQSHFLPTHRTTAAPVIYWPDNSQVLRNMSRSSQGSTQLLTQAWNREKQAPSADAFSRILPSRLSGDSMLSNSSARAQIRYFRTQAGPSIQALTRVGNDKR